MNYAIIEEGIVVNSIVGPLPDGTNGIPLNDRPVAIGDAYSDGVFYRDGKIVLSPGEYISQLESTLAEILEALNG